MKHQILVSPHTFSSILNSSVSFHGNEAIKRCSVLLPRLEEPYKATQELGPPEILPGVLIKKCVVILTKLKDDQAKKTTQKFKRKRYSQELLSKRRRVSLPIPKDMKRNPTRKFHQELKVLISRLDSAGVEKLDKCRSADSLMYDMKECAVLVSKLKTCNGTESKLAKYRPFVGIQRNLKKCIVSLSKVDLCNVAIPKLEDGFSDKLQYQLKECTVVLTKSELHDDIKQEPVDIVPYSTFIDMV